MGSVRSRHDGERWSRLVRRAREHGTVPVIVTLEIDVVPEGNLPPAERDEQQKRIADVRRALLEELGGTRLELVAAFDAVPQVALSVDLDGLAVLERSPGVRFVAEDVPTSPGRSR